MNSNSNNNNKQQYPIRIYKITTITILNKPTPSKTRLQNYTEKNKQITKFTILSIFLSLILLHVIRRYNFNFYLFIFLIFSFNKKTEINKQSCLQILQKQNKNKVTKNKYLITIKGLFQKLNKLSKNLKKHTKYKWQKWKTPYNSG